MFIIIYLLTPDEDLLSNTLVFNCSLYSRRRIGEYISLDLFYFVSLSHQQLFTHSLFSKTARARALVTLLRQLTCQSEGVRGQHREVDLQHSPTKEKY